MSLDAKRARGHSNHAVTLGVFSYVLCSSLAMVVNKMVFRCVDASALVFSLQIFVTVGFLVVASVHGFIKVDAFSWRATLAFLPYVASFVLTQYSSGRALAQSNVETIIVFRASSPLVVSVFDWLCLGHELPDLRGFLALLGIIAGSVAYVMVDSEFALRGVIAYKWVTLNMLGVVFEMVYGKGLLQGLEMDSPEWTSVMYTNALSLVPMFILGASTGEFEKIDRLDLEQNTGFVPWLILSCFVGAALSWAGWNCRNLVSATVYTVLGVICKLISVVLSMALGNKHASFFGFLALFSTVFSSAMYTQSPMRSWQPKTWDQCPEAISTLEEASKGPKGENSEMPSETSGEQGFWLRIRARAGLR